MARLQRTAATATAACLLACAYPLSSAFVPGGTNQHEPAIDLQAQHPPQTPSQMLRGLAQFCDDHGIDAFDVYGDFGSAQDESYLRQFEADVAQELGMDDAVFMPSGVMSQSIALLMHDRLRDRRGTFACHRTSHLLLHEGKGYSELLNMGAIVLPLGSEPCGGPIGNTLGVEPMRLSDVEQMMSARAPPSTIILELPHRELGGKLTPWAEVEQMGQLCRKNGVAFHADGARLFEAAAGYGISLQEVTRPFDSVYVSFYKGLGGISGAMLLGNADFCSEARIWLRRFGGNLYTLLPYAVSAWAGFKKRGLGIGGGPTFSEKRNKLECVVKRLSEDDDIKSIVTFEPQVPDTNMIHGLVRASFEDCQKAVDVIYDQSGVKVLSRYRAISEGEKEGTSYGCRFEWTMGDANAAIDDDIFVEKWKELAQMLAADAKQ